jgi:hypothetical protein
MKKEIRITIDGFCGTGKTLLAFAFADFLKQNGIEDAQITFLNDSGIQFEEAEGRRIIEEAVAHNFWKDTEFVFVERNTPRPFIAEGVSENPRRWKAKPDQYTPIFSNQEHIDYEMGRGQPMTDEPHGFSTAEVMERHYGLGSAKLPAKLRLRPSTREILEQARQANPNALNASAALLPHKTRDEMIAEAEARLKGDDYADRSVQSFLGLAEAAKDDELRIGTPLFDRKTHGALASAGGDALLTMTSQQVRESSPILETLEDITKNHFAVRATDARVFRPEGGWPAEFGGTVLGHPLGQDNGDHNGELESGFKYQMQIHPLTGETRNQMLVRARPFIRTAHLGGHLALDYSNLPVDLVFDEQCGVRWKIEAEMLQTQQEVDTIFEQAQGDTVVKQPRGMSRSVMHIDDAGLWPGGVAPIASPADPVLKDQMERIADLDVWKSYPDSRRGMTICKPAEALLQAEEMMLSQNLTRVADVNNNGQVDLPKTGD